ncbi:MAG TPA: S16 family serine protease, partial [Thermoanaerobaculia bacterium]|nr:S16 family serine protease [Thermoanaerobaculia bacterium]
QNHAFSDHYLDVEYDLSKVMFIATANVLHPVPPPLRDRMEVIQLSGYTPREKLAIAQQFLVPKQLDKHGLGAERVRISDDAINGLIDSYTREAGVRNLEREIAAICRKVARRVVEAKKDLEIEVKGEDLQEYLGKIRFRSRRKSEESEVGVATGLAWTEAGGELLETEVGLMKGKGKLTLTGKLGEVMQESARAAVSYLRSRADVLGIDPDFSDAQDLHIHVPEGAIPKDGPSAGITMATALVSALTAIPVRKDVAMTGEITLRGKVLPVGGIKDKVLAAYRADIVELILPEENEKDLDDLPDEVRESLTIHLVSSMDDVLRIALDGELSPMAKSDGGFEEKPADPPVGSGPVAH